MEVAHITSTYITLAKLSHMVAAPKCKRRWKITVPMNLGRKRTQILVITLSVYVWGLERFSFIVIFKEIEILKYDCQGNVMEKHKVSA